MRLFWVNDMLDQILKLDPVEVLGLTIIGEGRGEPIESQVAIGNVIRNRLNGSPNKYKTFSDVCLEHLQFSCWNDNDPNLEYLINLGKLILNGTVINDKYLKQCIFVAKGIADNHLIDNTFNAKYYMVISLFNSASRPKWANITTNLKFIGRHIYFSIPQQHGSGVKV